MKKILSLLLCVLSVTVSAQNKPLLKSFSQAGFIFGKASDNGKWVTQYQEIESSSSAQLINLDSYEVIDLQSNNDIAQHGFAVPIDVTDDGNILVGSYEGKPAYLNRTTSEWTTLSAQPGCVYAVTPDGRYAVGATNNGGSNESGYEMGWYTETYPKMWDLTTNKEVYISDMALPFVSPVGDDLSGMVTFHDISPDGRYILGNMHVDYPDYAFVLDRQANNNSGAFQYIGYKATDESGLKYEKTIPGLHFCSPRSMSPNGQWVVCNGYFVNDSDEFYAAIRYNIATGETVHYSDTRADQDMYSSVIDNDGNIYAGTPAGSPIREFYIRSGRYWYSLRSVLSQKYGIDFDKDTGLDNTGTPCSISADGMIFTAMVDPQFGQNMVMKMNERLVDVCRGLNLLGVYTIEPVSGSTFSALSQIKVTFDRDVEVVGEQTAASFGSWTSLSGNGLYVDPSDSHTIVAAFRNRTLEEGRQYEFKIPAGTISIKGDSESTNNDITATFIGRSDQPVKALSVYPSDGSTISKIDNASSPILITMDCNVMVNENAEAWMETTADHRRICSLVVAYKDNSVALYPATTQYLYKDVQYTVVLKAGSVTDVMGGGAMTDDYKITYYGGYERETEVTSGILFADDFNNISQSLAQWLLFEGDGQTPTDEMKALEFDNDNTPWNFSIHETLESTNYCAASHSCYNPSAQSIDWMLTPQIYIPDNLARLTFQAQSYRKGKRDILQVFVWEYDGQISYVGEDEYFSIIEQGEKVIEEVLSPGDDEETLENEWQNFTVDLSKWAGKNVYIAFGNENINQSMIFVDNVMVYRDMPFTVTMDTPLAVENKNTVDIAGTLVITNADNTYHSITLELKDAAGNKVDELSQQGLSLKNGDTYHFAFAKPLSLEKGEDNRYIIDVCLDEALTTVSYSIKNLVFTPVKRVVLEEKTGVTCGNCPQGIIAIENMQRMYGSQFIPISIHTYDGDQWGAGLSAYSTYLGLSAAPTAVVQRSSGIVMPMTTGDDFTYTFNYNGTLWQDKVAQEMEIAADIDISASVKYDEATGIFEVPVTLRSALNKKNLNLNVFMVLMEDGLLGYQDNYFASNSDPALGDWGLGGRHGQSVATNITHNDVVRYCYGTTYAGTSGLLPQEMEAGKEYSTVETLGGVLPGTVENFMNAKIAVLIIDANNDCIVNACVAYFDPSKNSIGNIAATAGDSHTYNLHGQAVDAKYRGIVIRNGKKYISR